MRQKVKILAVLLSLIYLPIIGACAKETPMPAFNDILQWFNTPHPLTREDLQGKVIVVDFWTYSCINCIRSFPYRNDWNKKYHDHGFEIIGVHTPEFHFEQDPKNVQAAILKFGVGYPIAMDNNYKTWEAYGARGWPSTFIIDRNGFIRFRHFGEGNQDLIENEIAMLLAEGNPRFVRPAVKPSAPAVDFSKIKTPEIFLGFDRLSRLGNNERVLPGTAQTFKMPNRISKNKFYLEGTWTIEKEFIRLESSEGRIVMRYEANKVNLVLSIDDDEEKAAQIYLDDKPLPVKHYGSDVVLEKGQATLKIHAARMYNLIYSDYGAHTLDIRFNHRGIKVYTITFG